MKIKLISCLAGIAVLQLFVLVQASIADDKNSNKSNSSMAAIRAPMSNFRAPDKKGLNVFEAPKHEEPFNGVGARIGAQFAMQYQGLDHSNSALPNIDEEGNDLNQLKEIHNNFNLATANLDVDVQLAKGVRTHFRTYMSSRHHPEPYVKNGYLQIDSLDFIDEGFLDDLMDKVTIKVGHMELNYGDAHFRRSDNAQAFFNPFVGNLIMDGFSTEVAGEVYFKSNGYLGMVGVSNGKLNQSVADEQDGVAVLGKLGYDKQFNEDFRFRLTGSVYNTAQSGGVRLYSGDRTGSRYYYVTENTLASASSNFRSGRFDPAFRNEITAFMFNLFTKWGGWEFFGTFETANGKSDSEGSSRTVNQYAADLLYRFGRNERFYVGGRYNLVDAELAGGPDVTIDRFNLGGGWFLTDNMLAKLEYVKQTYSDYPQTSILSGAEFDGVMLETVVAF